MKYWTRCREDVGGGVPRWMEKFPRFPFFSFLFFLLFYALKMHESVSRGSKNPRLQDASFYSRDSLITPPPPHPLPTSCRSFDHNYLKHREVLQNCRSAVFQPLWRREFTNPKVDKTRNFCRLETPFYLSPLDTRGCNHRNRVKIARNI